MQQRTDHLTGPGLGYNASELSANMATEAIQHPITLAPVTSTLKLAPSMCVPEVRHAKREMTSMCGYPRKTISQEHEQSNCILLHVLSGPRNFCKAVQT